MDEVEVEEQIESPVDEVSVEEFVDSPLEYVPEIKSSRTDLIEEFSGIESAIGRHQFISDNYDITKDYHLAQRFHEEISVDLRNENITAYVNRYPLQKFEDQEDASELLIKEITAILNESNKSQTHINREYLQNFLNLVRSTSLSDVEKNAMIYVYLLVITDTQISETIEDNFEHLREKSLLAGVFDVSVDEVESQLTEKRRWASSTSDESMNTAQHDILLYSGISMAVITVVLGISSLYYALIGTMYMGFPVWEMLGIISIITTTLASVLISLGSD